MNFEVHLATLLSRSEEYSTTKKFKKKKIKDTFCSLARGQNLED